MRMLLNRLLLGGVLLLFSVWMVHADDASQHRENQILTDDMDSNAEPSTCTIEPSNEAPSTVTDGTTGNTSSKTTEVPVGLQ